jgi:TRAP-type C4-dicarboxylate transport system permease large subunit
MGDVPRQRRLIGREFVRSIWALFMPFGLILGLRIGIFTASEALHLPLVTT